MRDHLILLLFLTLNTFSEVSVLSFLPQIKIFVMFLLQEAKKDVENVVGP